jgi:cyclic pyranopterin phosphate synthase
LELRDSFGRIFKYLRLSVTDVCNFRCNYCLPNGYQKTFEEENPLSLFEIENLISAFAQMGFEKVRLTGGEPTVRRDIIDIVSVIKAQKGIEKIALSTNAYRLKSIIKPLKAAGLTHVNISLDSVVAGTFNKITGKNMYPQVIDGIDAALAEGIKVKLNAVLLKELNFPEWELYLNWVKDKPVSFRFIELMRTGDNQDFFRNQHLKSEILIEKLRAGGWTETVRGKDDGPAQDFVHSEYQGRIGIIAPYGTEFCDSCNRLRVSALGKLRMCLFGESEFEMRPWLSHPSDQEEIIRVMRNLLERKARSHDLHENKYGMNYGFSAIGG